MFETHFWLPFPRRKSTPTIQGNKTVIEKKLYEAIAAGKTSWEEIKVSVEAYAKSDKVRDGYIQMPMTWVNAEGWNYEYEIPQSAEEILAAKPRAERTDDEWHDILLLLVGKKGPWATHYLKAHPELTEGAPDSILGEYGLEKSYG